MEIGALGSQIVNHAHDVDRIAVIRMLVAPDVIHAKVDAVLIAFDMASPRLVEADLHCIAHRCAGGVEAFLIFVVKEGPGLGVALLSRLDRKAKYRRHSV